MDSVKEEALSRHNEHRTNHGVPPLVWCSRLEKSAMKWADSLAKKGYMQHEMQDEQGENIAVLKGEDLDGAKATDMWYEEVKDYNFDEPGFNSNTGHFTQVVWGGTKEIGVAKATSSKGIQFMVARYAPPGNTLGEFPDHVKRATDTVKPLAKKADQKSDKAAEKEGESDGKADDKKGKIEKEGESDGKADDKKGKTEKSNEEKTQNNKDKKTTDKSSKSSIVSKNNKTNDKPKNNRLPDKTKSDEKISKRKNETKPTNKDEKSPIAKDKPSNDQKQKAKESIIYGTPKKTLKNVKDDNLIKTSIENVDIEDLQEKDDLFDKYLKEDEEFCSAMYTTHNEYRYRHGALPLQWSDTLASIAYSAAQSAARTNKMGSVDMRAVGQTMAAMTGGASGAKVSGAWYHEQKYFNYNNPGFSANTGSFTQMIWKGSRDVGVARAFGPQGQVYVVALYQPPGNIRGMYKENIGKPTLASKNGGKRSLDDSCVIS